mgnify:CR=1 FL=1
MIDFGCRQFDMDELMKCGLGLTKAEFKVFKHFIEDASRECDARSVADELGLNLTTVQKAVKKLSLKGIVIRRQKNLEKGSYIFVYEASPKDRIREIIKEIVRNWSLNVEKKMDEW